LPRILLRRLSARRSAHVAPKSQCLGWKNINPFSPRCPWLPGADEPQPPPDTFVPSLVGLDREAEKRAFDSFLSGKTLNANQIQLANLVIDYLTQSGWIEASQLYESHFSDFSPKGVEGIFSPEQVKQLIGVLSEVRQRAAAAA